MKIVKKNSFLKSALSVILSIAVLNMSFATPQVEQMVVLKAGTVVPLETVSLIKSDNATVGRTIDFRVTRDIEVDGETVIPAGAIAKGQVTRSDKAGLAIILGLFVFILFLFMKGKDGEIPPGFSFDANVASTINIEA